MVLEDHPATRTALVLLLRRAGFMVVDARDGARAVELGLDRGRRLDALIADLDTPSLSGVEVAVRLREDQPGLCVILMSGNAAGARAQADERLGKGTAVLQKPFDVQHLVDMLAHNGLPSRSKRRHP